MKRIKIFGNIDFGLYASLVTLGLLPAIYTAVRTNFLGHLPSGYAYSIAGQLSWVNLIYEVVNEAIILPLFCFLAVEDKKEFRNRLRTGLLMSVVIYIALSLAVSLAAVPLLNIMAVSKDILAESAVYIRIESAALVFGILYDFAMVALITTGSRKQIYTISLFKCAVTVVLDIFLVSSLPVSLRLGVNGMGISNVISNILMFAAAVYALEKEGWSVFSGPQMSFCWMKGLAKTGGISGLESFVRNAAYMLMVSRMVNIVGEQGTYWAANSFIWGWILLPVLQLGELIKRDAAKKSGTTDIKGYMALTAVICLMWAALVPLYGPFMQHVLGFPDTGKTLGLVRILLIPYVFFAFQNVFDAVFYGSGRTEYMLFESLVTNTIYYGAFYAAFLRGLWVPSLTGIAVMFGGGNIFDSLISGLAYLHFVRTKKQPSQDACRPG